MRSLQRSETAQRHRDVSTPGRHAVPQKVLSQRWLRGRARPYRYQLQCAPSDRSAAPLPETGIVRTLEEEALLYHRGCEMMLIQTEDR